MNDDKQILSTKLSIGDYNAFQILTKLEYEPGLIKEESISELLRFTIRHILKQAHNQLEYLITQTTTRTKESSKQSAATCYSSYSTIYYCRCFRSASTT